MCIITLSALGVSAIATAIASSAAAAATASTFIGAGAGLAAFAGFTGSLTTAATAASVASVAGTVASVAAVVEGVALVTVGGVMGTVGAVQQAEQDRQMAEFQADQAAENSRLANREAEAIGLEGRQEQEELRLKMLAQKSSARTGFAASGVVLGSGSTADYEADIADAYDSDSRNLQYDIASRQWVKRVEATNSSDQSAFYKTRAKAASQGKTTSLLSGIFKTAGDAASSTVSGLKTFGALKKAGA